MTPSIEPPVADRLLVLGGGVAGLAAGYYAKQRGVPFVVLEAGHRPGGNVITLERGPFRFDSGAHRLHDKDPEVTAEMQRLLGPCLRKIEVPSRIYDEGELVRFPLSAGGLLAHPCVIG